MKPNKKKKGFFQPEFCEECGVRIPPTRETCPVCYRPAKKTVTIQKKKGLKEIEKMSEFDFRLFMALELRFGDGTGQSFNVRQGHKELTALFRKEFLELVGGRMRR